MVNITQATPITLAGTGFIAKPRGDFGPGEYKRLCNLELKDEILTSRRNVNSVFGQSAGSSVTPMNNVQRIIGNMGEYSLVTNGDQQWMVGSNTFVEIFNAFPGVPTTTNSYSMPVGFFRYNNRNYWLCFEFENTVAVRMVAYYDNAIPTPDVPDTYKGTYGSALTRAILLTFPSTSVDALDFEFKNFFLYKERLWIVSSTGVYFSKATDPAVFAVPDGGFFKQPGNTINWAMAIKDTIYTLCEDAVYALTYSVDPNEDSTQRPISDIIGGETGCVHLDTPYFINNLGIYAINGNNIEKVLDNSFDNGKDVYSNRLFSFEDYLVVNKYNPVSYLGNYTPPSSTVVRRNFWPNGQSTPTTGSEIAVGWSLYQVPSSYTRRNLIPNAGFEYVGVGSGIGYWSTPYIDEGTWSASQTVTSSTTIKHSGSKAAQIAQGDTSGTLVGLRSEYLTILQGTYFTASAWLYTTGAASVAIKVEWLTSGGGPVYGSDDLAVPPTEAIYTIPPNVWTRVANNSLYAPAGATRTRVSFVFKGTVSGSLHYIDDTVFEVGTDIMNYFDGGFPNTTMTTHSWEGTAHQSVSKVVYQSVISNTPNATADPSAGASKVLSFSGGYNGGVDYNIISSALPKTASYRFTLTPSTVKANNPHVMAFRRRIPVNFAEHTETVIVESLNASDVIVGTYTSPVKYAARGISEYADVLIYLNPPLGTTKFRVTYNVGFETSNTLVPEAFTVYLDRFFLEQSTSYLGFFNGATVAVGGNTPAWTGTAYNSESTSTASVTHTYLKNRGSKFTPFLEGNSLGYNTFFINSATGSVHVLDFLDQYTTRQAGQAGFIVDAIVNPNTDSSGNYKFLFITNKGEEVSGPSTFSSFAYYMSSSAEDVEVRDFAVDKTNKLLRVGPAIDVEWDSISPDETEYFIKKFRSILIQGTFPYSAVGPEYMAELYVAYDNEQYVLASSLGDQTGLREAPRAHFAHRVGLNQRAKSLTLRLKNNPFNQSQVESYGSVEISDMTLLWTPAYRATETRTIGS